MQSSIRTMAFNGIDTIPVDVQVHLSNGMPSIAIVGLADKAVAESKERVRAALSSIGVALPPKRIAINLAPADINKEGSHYDLPIALGLMMAMGLVPEDSCQDLAVMGELSLNGNIAAVTGVLPAAIGAAAEGMGLICPYDRGIEASYAGDIEIIAAPSLTALINHLRSDQVLAPPSPRAKPPVQPLPDMAALVGGGHRARPGEVSLAHNGILFLDELAEWQRPHLDSLRQTIETHKAVVSRANHHVTYPARFQLIAAMNPCRCGYLGDPARACSRAPLCSQQYLSKISGPMLDRFDLLIEVPEVPIHMMMDKSDQETSADIRARVMAAQQKAKTSRNQQKLNADLSPDEIDATIKLDDVSRALLHQAAEKNALSARGFHRVLRVARTIADLANDEQTKDFHLAEALQYRRLATES